MENLCPYGMSTFCIRRRQLMMMIKLQLEPMDFNSKNDLTFFTTAAGNVKLTSLVDLHGLFPKIQNLGSGDPSPFGNWGSNFKLWTPDLRPEEVSGYNFGIKKCGDHGPT